MSKTAVIYWSSTGNTEAMAKAIVEGIESAGGEAELFNVSEITVNDAEKYEVLALGCSAMGAENLEEDEFEPFFTELEGKIKGKKIALFGSYGWGDGQWMRDWEERVVNSGAQLLNGGGLIINEMPDDEGIDKCRALGKLAV